MPTDYFPNGRQQVSQALVFDDSCAKSIANMPDGTVRFVTNAGRPSVSEDLVWGPTTVTAIGGQPNVVNISIVPIATGSVQQGAFYARIDGTNVGGAIERLAGIFEATTGGGTGAGTGNLIGGLNVNVYQRAADTTVQLVGIELSVNSNKADATLDMTPPQVGLSLVSGGSKIAEVALSIAGGPQWIEGIQISQDAIAAGGFAFRYKGRGASGVVSISADSVLTLPLGTGTGAVSAGAQNSGGGGFRQLVVPN